MEQVHVYVIGDVTGVGFRAWTKVQAKLNGVTGWVRNVYTKPDIFGTRGGVEAVLQGKPEQLKTMLELLKKGSAISRVEQVEVTYQEPKEVFESFEIRA